MPVPTVADCQAYLGETSWVEDDISSAFASEFAAQARICRHPVVVFNEEDPPVDITVWPEDLAEALFRRVAHNLGLRALPLGLQASITETGGAIARVGGTDAEVRRLEAPHRKLLVG